MHFAFLSFSFLSLLSINLTTYLHLKFISTFKGQSTNATTPPLPQRLFPSNPHYPLGGDRTPKHILPVFLWVIVKGLVSGLFDGFFLGLSFGGILRGIIDGFFHGNFDGNFYGSFLAFFCWPFLRGL